MSNEQLAEELHKPIIVKFNKRKVYSLFKINIWGAYLPDIQSISNLYFYFMLFIFLVNMLGLFF